jgi:hypothetical protein
MASQISGRALLQNVYGIKVDKASATLPASTNQTLFTISGGRIILTGIVGEVTTAVQAQACNTKLTSAPTVGTAVDLCAVLDITGDEVGCLYGITGTFATAMLGANAGATVLPAPLGIIIPVGVIRLNTAATNTGATKWSMTYVPLDDGASVVSV